MATGGRGYEDDDQLVFEFEQLSVRAPDVLNVHCYTHKSRSRLMATISWTYRRKRPTVDSWKLRVRNLTWEQNDYDYGKKIFRCDRGMNKYKLPLWFRPGNRYQVTVYGRQHKGNRAEVVCKESIEFRTGEVLTMDEVYYLKDAATEYLRRKSTSYAPCKWFYRNKSRSYFEKVAADGGVMKTLLKDASGDELSPINGEISGLFFLANVDYNGEPFDASPFGNTRLLVRAEIMLALAPSVYFADFYCMNGKDHYVTLVLARPGSDTDRLCANRLPRLSLNDQHNNPFIFNLNNELRTVKGKELFVEVFFTENLDTDCLIRNYHGKIQYNIFTFGHGSTTLGGRRKSTYCSTCRASRVASSRPDEEW